jgi:hypothetical protein
MMSVIPNSMHEISGREDPRRDPKPSSCRAKKSQRDDHLYRDLHAIARLQAKSGINRTNYGQEYCGELLLMHPQKKKMKRKCGNHKQRADRGR